MGSSSLISKDGFKIVETNKKEGLYQLYNILADNEERNELSQQHPERLSQLTQKLKSEINSKRPDL